ncbi:MAG: GHKL domain-containing protein [Eubacterium sp.]|nr:GHKL domain-containing protein [Eubacterium sp.]
MEIILHLSSDLLDIYSGITFMNVLLNNRKKTPTSIIILCFSIYMGVLWGLEYIPSVPVTILASSAMLFSLTLLYNGKWIVRILTVLFLSLSTSLGETLFTLIARPFIPDLYTTDDYRVFLLMMFGSSICEYLITRIILVFWRIAFHRERINFSLLALLSPILSIFMLDAFAVYNVERSVSDGFLISFFIFNVVINIVNYWLVNYVIRYNNLTEKMSLMKQQNLLQEAKYDQLSSAYRNTRSIVHDVKKHYLTQKAYLDKGEYDTLSEYLDKCMDTLEHKYIQFNTGNLVLDTFISNHKTMAEERGIRFITKIRIDKDRIPVDDYQLSIIIGNLLDNALNECRLIPAEQDPFIRLLITMDDHDHFIIQIANSKNRTHPIEPKEPLYHGYGLQNIEMITEKMNGMMVLEKDNPDIFSVNISIPITNPAKRQYLTLK